MDTYPASGTPTPEDLERRKHHRVREIFEEAVELIAPFFLPENSWGHHSLDHLAYRSLRETYPALSIEEVHVLVVAAKRVHATRSAAPADRGHAIP